MGLGVIVSSGHSYEHFCWVVCLVFCYIVVGGVVNIVVCKLVSMKPLYLYYHLVCLRVVYQSMSHLQTVWSLTSCQCFCCVLVKKNGQKSQHQRKQEKWKHCKENALQQMLQLTSEKCCSPGGHIEKGKSFSLP